MTLVSPGEDLELSRLVEAVKRNNFIIQDPVSAEHTAIQVDAIGLYIRLGTRGDVVDRCLVALLAGADGGLREIALDDRGLPSLMPEPCTDGLWHHSSSIFEVVEMFNQSRSAEGRQNLQVLAVR